MAWLVLQDTIVKLGARLRRLPQGLHTVPGLLAATHYQQMTSSLWAVSSAPHKTQLWHVRHLAASTSMPAAPPFLGQCMKNTFPSQAAASCGLRNGSWSSHAAIDNHQQLYVPNNADPGTQPRNLTTTRQQAPSQRGICSLVTASQPRYVNSDFLDSQNPPSAPLYLVLLNYRLPRCVTKLWHKAAFKICADGGANQLFDILASYVEGDTEQRRRTFWPDAIVGDLDSVREDVQLYYRQGGSLVMDLSQDQDSTDACKCLMHLEQMVIPPGGSHTILVCGALGGRLDHTLANLNALHKFAHLNIVLIGDGNMARLIQPGCTVIRLPPSDSEGPRCGLVPLLYPAVVTTSGLKWNVDRTQLSMGGLISTSNMLAGTGDVTVETDSPLVWMTEVAGGEGQSSSW